MDPQPWLQLSGKVQQAQAGTVPVDPVPKPVLLGQADPHPGKDKVGIPALTTVVRQGLVPAAALCQPLYCTGHCTALAAALSQLLHGARRIRLLVRALGVIQPLMYALATACPAFCPVFAQRVARE